MPFQVLVDGRGSTKRCLGPVLQKHQVVLEEHHQFEYMLSEDPHDHKIQIYSQSGTPEVMTISVELVL